MQLVVNGETHQVENNVTVQQLLERLRFESKSIAVAINGRFVPRHEYETLFLQDQQALEVLSPMQGG